MKYYKTYNFAAGFLLIAFSIFVGVLFFWSEPQPADAVQIPQQAVAKQTLNNNNGSSGTNLVGVDDVSDGVYSIDNDRESLFTQNPLGELFPIEISAGDSGNLPDLTPEMDLDTKSGTRIIQSGSADAVASAVAADASGTGSTGSAAAGSAGSSGTSNSSSSGSDSSGSSGAGGSSPSGSDNAIPSGSGGNEIVYNNIYYISPNGTSSGSGTINSPWDIVSTLAGQQRVRPGDAVYLLEGIYRCANRSQDASGYEILLTGLPNQPTLISAAPGHHVLIDGGFVVRPNSSNLRLENMEITVSENQYMSRTINESGSRPQSYGRPWGGIIVVGGENLKFINLLIHDCAQGIQWWQDAINSEVYGCIFYGNGWITVGAPCGYGHDIYTMNKEGIKTIENSIMAGRGYGFSMHGYTSPTQSDKYVNNFLAQKNICYEAGPFLFGGSNPSKNIRLVENVFYKLDKVYVGYSASYNYDCYVHGNYFVEAPLEIKNFRDVDKIGNYEISKASVVSPESVKSVFIFKNKYDSNRAHVAVFNWGNRSWVDMDVSLFLTVGDRYCFLDPHNLYDAPVKKGFYDGGKLRIQMNGYFAAFVLLKSSDGSDPQKQLGNAIVIPIPET